MITGAASSEFISLLRKANKLINLWIEEELPYIHTNVVKNAIAINKQKLKEETNPTWLETFTSDNEYTRKVYEEDAQKLVDDPNFDFIAAQKIRPAWNKCDESKLLQKCLYSLKKIRSAIESNSILSEEKKRQQITAWLKHYRIVNTKIEMLANNQSSFDFNLFLYPEYRDDDEVIIDQKYMGQSSAECLKRIIHDIKKHIEAASQGDLIYLFNINILLMKITLLLPFMRLEDDSAQDFSILEKWARIGSLLINKSKSNQECCDNRDITELLTAAFYGNIAYHVSHTSKKENIFAHSYLEICLAFNEKNEEYIERLRLCTLSRIALNEGEIGLALEHVEKAYADYRKAILFLIEMLYCVGKAYTDLNKEITIKCYRRAIALIETKKLDGGFHLVDQPNIDIPTMTTFINQYRTAIIDELKKEFNNIKVTVRDNKLIVFLSLEELPRTQIRLSKNSPISCLKYHLNFEFKGKKLTGYQFLLSDENFVASITAVKDLNTKILKCFENQTNRKTVFEKINAKDALVLEPVIPSIKNMSIKDDNTDPNTQDNTSKEKKAVSKNTKYTKGINNTTTTSTTTTTTTPRPVIAPPLVPKRTAGDYGFAVFSRRPVTPVYFSCAHKESGRAAQIIVCWDDSKADDLDPIIINKFKELFNPQGVVQTRQTNESGFKISIGKKDEWIVRGKLKGIGGSTRVYFKPIETVTNEDKSTTTLCILHKKMSK